MGARREQRAYIVPSVRVNTRSDWWVRRGSCVLIGWLRVAPFSIGFSTSTADGGRASVFPGCSGGIPCAWDAASVDLSLDHTRCVFIMSWLFDVWLFFFAYRWRFVCRYWCFRGCLFWLRVRAVKIILEINSDIMQWSHVRVKNEGIVEMKFHRETAELTKLFVIVYRSTISTYYIG